MTSALFHVIDVLYGFGSSRPVRIHVVTDPAKLTNDYIYEQLMATGCVDRWFHRPIKYLSPSPEMTVRGVFDLMIAETFVACAEITGDVESVIKHGFRQLPPLNGSHGIHIVKYGSISLGWDDHTITAKSVEFRGLRRTDLIPEHRSNYFF